MSFPSVIMALLLALLTGLSTVNALGQQRIISFCNGNGTLQLTGNSSGAGQILVSENDYWGVIRAAGDLAVDFGRVTGTNFTISNGIAGSSPAAFVYNPVNNMNNTYYTTTGTDSFFGPNYTDPSPSDTVIIAGTIGNSTIIDSMVSAGLLDVSNVEGQWESFTSQVVQNPTANISQALVIAGSDPRGTIYGLYDISEQIGVSPYYFWADVPVKQRSSIYALPIKKVQTSPSVKYRGLFLNDEQPALTNWVASHWPDTHYGPGFAHQFYSLIFEVILRLRANYLWPAIWATMFEVDDPENQPLACAYEVVLGSSHTEPLMRAQNEFGMFYPGPWAYNLNNATINQYFEYGVQRAKPYARNSLWTMGMRGTGDSAIEGLGTSDIVNMLDILVQNQQQIISDGLGVNITTVPQMWCLYKEVQSYIFAGLQVPADVTLLWADDNWGNVRRMPLLNETSRAGGAGVYYHFDYVGDPRDYKWINTIQLSKTAQQMSMAYDRGSRRIWIVNVGDFKALEVPIAHFFDMAYDAETWDADSAGDWLTAWATREFGSTYAANISDIMQKYGMYANRRKYELIEIETYSVINYGEGDAVLAQWAALLQQAETVYNALPSEAQPAFFEMVLHSVTAGEIVNRIYITAAKNALYAAQQRNSANDMLSNALAAGDEDANLTMAWNSLLGGKWNHFMDQTHLGYQGYWQQPMRDQLPAMIHVQTEFVALAGQIGVGVEGSNATVSGDDQWHPNSSNDLNLPPMDPYGPEQRYFDVFSRGTQACQWSATPWQPYVTLSQDSGTVGGNNGTDTRVYVSIDWSSAPAAPSSTTVNINITTPCRAFDRYGYAAPIIQVPVVNRNVPPNFTEGFVESDGHVSIEGPHYQSLVDPTDSSGGNVTYHTFNNLGRTLGGVSLWPQNTEKLTLNQAPAIEYDVYLFTNTTKANVAVLISPSQNVLGDYNPLQYGIALYPAGSAPPSNVTIVTPVGPSVGTSMPTGWQDSVRDGVWGHTGNYTTSVFSVPQEGAYTLRIWALMPNIIIQKVIIDLGGVRPSFLGPPESFLVS